MYSKENDSTVQSSNMLLRALAGHMNGDTEGFWLHLWGLK